jgi:predicted PurR-regulated permease PerM
MAGSVPSTRAIAKVFFTLLGLTALTYLLYLVRSVVILIFIGAFLAVALGPAVDLFNRWISRVLSILLVYFLITAGVFGVGLLVVPPVVNQVQGLANDIPRYLKDLRKNKQFRKYDQKYKITQKLNQQAQKLPSRLATAAGTLRDVTVGVFAAATQLITVLTITFLLLLDGKRLLEAVFRLMPPERERRYRKVSGDIYRAISGYVAGNLLISVIAGTVTYITLTVLNVPFAAPLSVLMAFLDLIPIVGATIGGLLIGIVTAFNDFPTSTIIWVIVFIVYQQIENNLLQPVIYRKTVNVPPLAVIVAVLIGGSLLGVLGALVAIPIAAMVQILGRDWWEFRQQRGEVPVPIPP